MAHPWEQGQGFTSRRQETDHLYAHFRSWLDLGPGRTLKAFCQVSGLGHASARVYSSVFQWPQRAALYDQEQERLRVLTVEVPAPPPPDEDPPPLPDVAAMVVETRVPEVVEKTPGATAPVDAVEFRVPAAALKEFQRRAKAAQAEHQARLSDFRQRMEELGRMQTRAARNLMVLASSALQAHHRHGELSPAERKRAAAPYFPMARVTSMFTTANTLAASGSELEARALGVEQLILQVQSIAQVDHWMTSAGDITEDELLELLPPEALTAAAEGEMWDVPDGGQQP